MVAHEDADEARGYRLREEDPPKDFKQTPFPIFWDLTRRCMNADGNFLHFPRGTYKEQVSTSFGRIELDLMETLWSMGQTLSRWSKGPNYYKPDHLQKFMMIDKQRIEALEDWYAKKQERS